MAKSKIHKASELREMSDEQLQLTLKEAREDFFRLRLQAETERLDAPSELRKHRRLIARVQTIQRQRQLQGAGAAPAATQNGQASTQAPAGAAAQTPEGQKQEDRER